MTFIIIPGDLVLTTENEEISALSSPDDDGVFLAVDSMGMISRFASSSVKGAVNGTE